jgi:hypothetical protein
MTNLSNARIAERLIRHAMQTHKKCSNCFQIKPLSAFYTRKAHDGYQTCCKACKPEVCRGYRLRKRGLI